MTTIPTPSAPQDRQSDYVHPDGSPVVPDDGGSAETAHIAESLGDYLACDKCQVLDDGIVNCPLHAKAADYPSGDLPQDKFLVEQERWWLGRAKQYDHLPLNGRITACGLTLSILRQSPNLEGSEKQAVQNTLDTLRQLLA